MAVLECGTLTKYSFYLSNDEPEPRLLVADLIDLYVDFDGPFSFKALKYKLVDFWLSLFLL
jgi:hypothetical protein